MAKNSNFVIQVATVNGSGSQSSNNILVRSLFRSGLPVGGKNLFPSNIQGLPTWFTIRVNEQGFTSRRALVDICVAMNAQTHVKDLSSVRPGGFYFYTSELKFSDAQKRSDIQMIAIPFRDIVAPLSDSVKLRKLLVNMTYVGILAELLSIEEDILEGAIRHQFEGKESVFDVNRKAVLAGRAYALEHLSGLDFPYRLNTRRGGNDEHILIDGNSAAAMGAMFGGCSFLSWYPITPSTSLVESFEHFANEHRVNEAGEKSFAVLQAEDELAAITMVLGAGWMGARAMTATSGPGLSLMSEAAGLSYYAEIPAVIWDVQRVGPSTGLPTRTMQGDVVKGYYLSHGDSKHPVLLPGSAEECFEFGQVAFDLAERLQTLVLVMSDLDMGMNFHIAKKFPYPSRPFDRGKVLNKSDLDKAGHFARYRDLDGDGIPYRTLPGTEHKSAAFFTRGTGHDDEGRYSEDGQTFAKNLDRLAVKWETAKTLIPQPVVDQKPGAKVALLAFGSTHEAVGEIRALMKDKGIATNYMRLRALPLVDSVRAFIEAHDRVYVVDQNHEGQLHRLLRSEFPALDSRLRSIRIYDGLPVSGEGVGQMILQREMT